MVQLIGIDAEVLFVLLFWFWCLYLFIVGIEELLVLIVYKVQMLLNSHGNAAVSDDPCQDLLQHQRLPQSQARPTCLNIISTKYHVEGL